MASVIRLSRPENGPGLRSSRGDRSLARRTAVTALPAFCSNGHGVYWPMLFAWATTAARSKSLQAARNWDVYASAAEPNPLSVPSPLNVENVFSHAAGMKSPQGGPDAASRWIAEASKWIEQKYQPTLSLIYLPHLDYNLQRLGPAHPAIAEDVSAIDAIVGELIAFFEARSVAVLVLSEYGISAVDTPIHLNRVFREQGWITVREELGLELLDCGASRAFAVADHQIAHVYLNDPALENSVRSRIESQPGVARVLGVAEKKQCGLDHPRAGDLVAVARENAWFTYYYWLDDALAPDFARCVDIHRKPGYDPVELFLDPSLAFPKLKILGRLLQKKLGFRMLMDVIPLDATLVKGSHGTCPASRKDWPILVAEQAGVDGDSPLKPTQVYDVIKRQILG